MNIIVDEMIVDLLKLNLYRKKHKVLKFIRCKILYKSNLAYDIANLKPSSIEQRKFIGIIERDIYYGSCDVPLSFSGIQSGSKPFNKGMNNKETTTNEDQHVPHCKKNKGYY